MMTKKLIACRINVPQEKGSSYVLFFALVFGLEFQGFVHAKHILYQ